jgi:cell division transport system permease protein
MPAGSSSMGGVCMSTIDPAISPDALEAANTAASAEADEMLPTFESPIVPNSTIAGRALVAVVAIMTFLASLTTGAVILVRAAASDWQSEVAREITIQLRPTTGRDIEADLTRAVDLARGFPGIAFVRPYSKDESARLLEPWLGSGLAFSDLPIPRLVVVRIASEALLDAQGLRAQLATIPGTSLDDHRGFVDRMRAMSGAAVFAGLAMLILMLAATVFSVLFATRAAMATNRPVIEVLHFIGAKSSFIAGHFQRHFLGLGLRGALIGGGCALILFAAAELLARRFFGSAAGDQFGALFGTFSIGIGGYILLLTQAVLIAVVTAVSSRYVVNQTLDMIQ